MYHVEDRDTSLRGDNTASVDTHFCSPDWVPDRRVSLSLEQTVFILKCLVQQGAFSVTERQEQNAWGSSCHKDWEMLRMCIENGLSPLLKCSLSPPPHHPTVHSVSHLLVKCTQDHSTAYSGLLPLILKQPQPEQPREWFHNCLPAGCSHHPNTQDRNE